MFNKDAKTVDETLSKKITLKNEFEDSIMVYKKNIECFLETATCKANLNLKEIVGRHNLLATTFKVVFENSPFE
jgi:hypothetical protein